MSDAWYQDHSEGKTPRYDPHLFEAYCKYCYKTHRLWGRFWDVFPTEIVWECEVCWHRTRDEYMDIEGVEASRKQRIFYMREGERAMIQEETRRDTRGSNQ